MTRTEHDGSITVLADSYDGKRLNSPNDVVVRSDGSIWFTDPAYGIDSDLEGHKSQQEQDECFTVPDLARRGAGDRRRRLRRARTGWRSRSTRRRCTSPTPAGRTTCGRSRWPTTCRSPAATSSRNARTACFDGFRLDTEGRIWTSAADGVHVYHPDGTLLGKILVPEVVANVQFGWPKRNRLYICGTTSLYAILLPVNGAKTM